MPRTPALALASLFVACGAPAAPPPAEAPVASASPAPPPAASSAAPAPEPTAEASAATPPPPPELEGEALVASLLSGKPAFCAKPNLVVYLETNTKPGKPDRQTVEFVGATGRDR